MAKNDGFFGSLARFTGFWWYFFIVIITQI
jgi:hypothetical protein